MILTQMLELVLLVSLPAFTVKKRKKKKPYMQSQMCNVRDVQVA